MSPKKIRRLRERLGMSQRQFAEALGVKQSTVWRWESGRATPGETYREILRFWQERLEDQKNRERLKELLKAGGALSLSVILNALTGEDKNE